MKITDPYSPTIDPAAFSTTIDNPYLPMVPGTHFGSDSLAVRVTCRIGFGWPHHESIVEIGAGGS